MDKLSFVLDAETVDALFLALNLMENSARNAKARLMQQLPRSSDGGLVGDTGRTTSSDDGDRKPGDLDAQGEQTP